MNIGNQKMNKMKNINQLLKGKKVKINIDEVMTQMEKVDSKQFFDNLPSMSYSPRPPGWNDIFRGLLSPHAKQYKNYLKPIIAKL